MKKGADEVELKGVARRNGRRSKARETVAKALYVVETEGLERHPIAERNKIRQATSTPFFVIRDGVDKKSVDNILCRVYI